MKQQADPSTPPEPRLPDDGELLIAEPATIQDSLPPSIKQRNAQRQNDWIKRDSQPEPMLPEQLAKICPIQPCQETAQVHKSARDTSKSTKCAERADPARINDLRISSNNREAQPQTSDWMKRETLPEPTMMPEQLAKTRANQRQEKAQMHNRLEISGKRSENAERAGSANASYKTRIAETSDNFNRCTNTRSQYHGGIQTAGTPTDKTCEIRTRPTTKDVTPAESDDQDAKTSVEADQHENRPRKDATTAEPDQHEIQSAAAAGTSIDTFNDAKNRKTRTRADVDEAIAGLLLEPEHPCVTRMHAYTTRCERRAGMLRVGPERQYRSLEYYGTHIRKTVSGMHHYDTRHALQWAHMSGATICD